MGECKTIIITGATGFLGSNLCARFGADHVVALKRSMSDCSRLERAAPGTRTLEIDNGTWKSALRVLEGPVVVVHTATSYGREEESAELITRANVDFPISVLEAMEGMRSACFINIDTVLPESLNAYTATKKQFLREGIGIARKQGIGFINVRLQNMYGPWDDPTKVTTHVIRSCAANVPVLELTAGEQIRDFIYIDDVASGIAAILVAWISSKAEFQEYELGSGTATPLRQFVETAHRLAQSSTKLLFGALPYRYGEVMRCKADVSALNAIGWRCSTGIVEGIQKILSVEGIA